MAAVAPKAKSPSINYFKGLDMWRFIGSVAVIFHHTTDLLYKKGYETKAASLHQFSGAFFLDVFFIISGFLISLILMKEYQQGTFSLKNFYVRRIIRIWPLYFLIVLVKLLIIPVVNHFTWESIQNNLFYACTFTVNYQLLIDDFLSAYTILWSVCVEEHLYLVLPFFLFIFKGKFKTIGWVFTIGGFIAWFYFSRVPSITGYSTAYFVSLSYFYFFGLGILLACLYSSGVKLKMPFSKFFQVLIMLMMVPVIFNIIPHNYTLAQMLFIYGLFGCYLVWAGLQDNFILNFKAPITKYLGNISYGMYLVHIMTMTATVRYFRSTDFKFSELLFGWGVPFVVTLITIAVATLLYFLFERPILKLKKRFTTVASK